MAETAQRRGLRPILTVGRIVLLWVCRLGNGHWHGELGRAPGFQLARASHVFEVPASLSAWEGSLVRKPTGYEQQTTRLRCPGSGSQAGRAGASGRPFNEMSDPQI